MLSESNKQVIKDASKRTAAYLDSYLPGWESHIDLESLDMENGEYTPGYRCGCVGAQLDLSQGGPGTWGHFMDAAYAADDEAEGRGADYVYAALSGLHVWSCSMDLPCHGFGQYWNAVWAGLVLSRKAKNGVPAPQGDPSRDIDFQVIGPDLTA